MIAPRGLVGAAFALWGYALGVPLLGVILGLAFEAVRFASPSAWIAARLTGASRIAIAFVVGSLVITAATGRFPHALYAWLRWLPAYAIVLPLAQALGGTAIALSSLVAALRPGVTVPEVFVDTTYPLVAVTLVGAATGANAGPWFYPAAAAIVAWALVARMPRSSRPAGIGLVVAAVALGFGVHSGLWLLQGQLEDMDLEALQEFFDPKPDPFREQTRIGDVGRRKLNDRILMRIVVEGPRPSQVLLREGAFDQYGGGEWKTSVRAFQPVPRQGERWMLGSGEAPGRLTIRRSLAGGAGLLALPLGARVIDQFPAESVERLASGAVRASGAPRFLAMRVAYGDAAESAAGANDLAVPDTIAGVLDRVIAEADLRRATPRETLAAVEAWFARRFFYSLDNRAGRTLADFFLTDPRGHCEYFATGTTLLLRRLGIPARYTVGFSAQEYSAFEHAYIVRHRHAHAWTSAFLDGRWVTVDTTPARWAADEAEEARSPFGPLLDALSWALDQVVLWWVESPPAEIARSFGFALLALSLPYLAYIAWRRVGSRARAARPTGKAAMAWNAIEALAARRGLGRASDETPRAWTLRMQREPGAGAWAADLAALARDYYRARFDPAAGNDAVDAFVREAEAFRRRLRDMPATT